MIGIVVVSHSHALAEAAIGLALELAPPDRRPDVRSAAGLADGGYGTDAAAIAEAVTGADSGDGVLVLLDLGSAVLSAEMAADFLDPDVATRVRISPAPLVEGLAAAVVAASIDTDLAGCEVEARRGCEAKVNHLGSGRGVGDAAGERPVLARTPHASHPSRHFRERLDLPHGLHARPAAAIVAALAPFEAEIVLRNGSRPGASSDASSAMGLLGLGLLEGDVLEADITGPDADAAHAALRALASARFGEA